MITAFSCICELQFLVFLLCVLLLFRHPHEKIAYVGNPLYANCSFFV